MKKVFQFIYRVFRCIRESIINLVFFLFILLCFSIVGIVSSLKQPSEGMAKFKEGALVLNLDGYLADNRDEYADLYRLLESEFRKNEAVKYSIFDVADAIKQAGNDPQIKGLVLDLDKLRSADYPALSYLGELIQAFKLTQKPVIAVGSRYSQTQYYLASFADKIYLNKAGSVDLQGLNYSSLYFKSMLNKIEAEPYIFRVGTYKSAVEPLIRDDMSPEAKQNARLWLNAMWENVRETMAENRKLTSGQILPEINKLLELRKTIKVNDADFALKQGLVTEVKSSNEIRTELAKLFGEDKKQGFKSIGYDDYATTLDDRFDTHSKNKIAVVNVEGEITMGKSLENTAGAETIVKQLRQVQEDEAVRGLILRINSPGGSAVASELIRQEVEAVQKKGLPVVASMGSMAASGGYWIAATSNAIVADPNTLTGSIGIFGVLFNLEKTAKNLGIQEDSINTSPLAAISGLKPLTSEQSELIQLNIEQGYEEFLGLVSRGRNMTKQEVDKLAQGQVWLGTAAKEKGLVDKLGTFDTAVTVIANDFINKIRAEQGEQPFENLTTEWFIERDNSLFAELSRSFSTKMQLKLANWFNLPFNMNHKTQQAVDFFAKFTDPKHSYLYCLNCGEVK